MEFNEEEDGRVAADQARDVPGVALACVRVAAKTPSAKHRALRVLLAMAAVGAEERSKLIKSREVVEMVLGTVENDASTENVYSALLALQTLVGQAGELRNAALAKRMLSAAAVRFLNPLGSTEGDVRDVETAALLFSQK